MSGNTDTDTNTDTNTTPPPAPPASSGYSQEQVDKWNAEARRKGQRQERAGIEEELGMSLEDAKAAIAAKAEADKAKLDDVERAKRDAEEATARANAAEAKLAKAELDARIERKLIAEGAPASGAPRIVSMLDSIEHNATDDDIAEAVAGLRSDLPALFTAANDDGDGDGNDGGDAGGSDDGKGDSGKGGDLGRSGVTGDGLNSRKTPAPVVTGLDAGRQRFRDKQGAGGDSVREFTERLRS